MVRLDYLLGLMLLFQVGCTSLHGVKKESREVLLSCEESAMPKSLEYLEQRYRCTSKP